VKEGSIRSGQGWAASDTAERPYAQGAEIDQIWALRSVAGLTWPSPCCLANDGIDEVKGRGSSFGPFGFVSFPPGFFQFLPRARTLVGSYEAWG